MSAAFIKTLEIDSFVYLPDTNMHQMHHQGAIIMNILLGIDIGTTKICAIAFDIDSGKVIAIRSAANDTSISREPDASEQDASKIINITIKLLAEVADSIGDSSKIAGIGVTGQMHGVLLVSLDGHPLTPLINWQDQRGNHIYKPTGRTYTDEVQSRIGEDLVTQTGTNPATGFGGVTLFRLAKTSGISKDATALTIHDYLVRHLTGVSATDATDAASWGIYDVEGETGWLPGIESCLDIPAGLLPKVLPTGSIAGTLLLELASKTGLPAGIPVAIAIGDNQASFIGSVPSIEESLLFNIGTGGQMSVTSDTFKHDVRLDTRPLIKGKWLKVGASLCGGSAFKILADFFSQVGTDLFGQSVSPESLYNKMTTLAESIPEDDNIPDFAPYFYGTRTDPTRTAQLLGINTTNFTPAHLSKSIIRGMAYELVSYYESAGVAQPGYIVGSGNGFRRNPVLRNEFEFRFNKQIMLPPNEEEAAVGAALTAGVATGAITDWNAAGEALYSI